MLGVDELGAGIERARDGLRAVLRGGQVVAAEPWEEIVALLDDALEHVAKGDKQAALQRVDEAIGHLKMRAMMSGGPSFENVDMEDERRTALQVLIERLPRSV